MSKRIFFVMGLLASLLLGACARDLPAGEYDTSEVGKIKQVASGTIISKRAVKFHSKTGEQSSAATPGTEFVDGGNGFVYVVKLNSGTIVSVAQAEDLKLKVGQRVLVVYGRHTRILPDNSRVD